MKSKTTPITFRASARAAILPQAEALAKAIDAARAAARNKADLHPALKFRSTEYSRFDREFLGRPEWIDRLGFAELHRKFSARQQVEHHLASARLLEQAQDLLEAAADAAEQAVQPLRDAEAELCQRFAPMGMRPDQFHTRRAFDRLLREAEGHQRKLRDRHELNRVTLFDIAAAARIFAENAPEQVGPSEADNAPVWSPLGAGAPATAQRRNRADAPELAAEKRRVVERNASNGLATDPDNLAIEGVDTGDGDEW